MAVYVNEKQRTFTLQTKNTTYQMKVDAYGMLLHITGKRRTIPIFLTGFRRMTADFPAMRMKRPVLTTDFPQILRRRSTAVSERGITGSVPCASEMKTGARR